MYIIIIFISTIKLLKKDLYYSTTILLYETQITIPSQIHN